MNSKVIRRNLQQFVERDIPEDANLWPAIRVQLESHRREHTRQKLPAAALPRVQRLFAALVVLACVLGLAFIAFPSFRARVMAQIILFTKPIGNMAFTEMERREPAEPPINPSSHITAKVIPLAEAQAALPFPIKLPSWAPEGFSLQEEEVWLYDTTTLPGYNPDDPYPLRVTLSWANPNTTPWGVIFFSIDYPVTVRAEVGPGSVEEVDINGKPAALIHGGWFEGEWQDIIVSLEWTEDLTAYELQCPAGVVSPEDLIRMAGSTESSKK